jgi:hypothetical protein
MKHLVPLLQHAVTTIKARYLALCVAIAFPSFAFAQTSSTTGLTAFDNAKTAAGTKTLSSVAAQAGNEANTGMTAFLLLCTGAGVVLVAISVWGLYTASRDDRETPKKAIVGVLVGGAMTIISLITAYSSNTLTA